MDDLRRLRASLHADYPVRPLVYWADLLVSAAAGWGALWLASRQPVSSALHWALAAAAFAGLYRAGYFVHELAHHRRALGGFEVAWHGLVGLWVLLPSVLVDPHIEHHRPETYGTARDPEYEQVATWGLGRCAASVCIAALGPVALWLRFAVVGPLSFCHPRLRGFTVATLSTLGTNSKYERPVVDGRRARFLVQEAAAGLVAWSYVALVVAGVLPARLVLELLGVMSAAFALNQLRTNFAHAYEGTGAPFTLEGQVADTATVETPALFAFFFPVGTRFHALHHLAPQLPYHALGRAHARLRERSPQAYARSNQGGLVAALASHVRRAVRVSAHRPPDRLEPP